MKRNTQYNILIIEALVCIGIAFVPAVSAYTFAGIMAFPFEQIGLILRALSLSGPVGNAVAIVLYSAICFSPASFLILRKNYKLWPEDSLIGLLILVMFIVVYQMINPGSITVNGGFSEGLPVAKAILGNIVYSILSGFIVLRILRLLYTGIMDRIQHYISVLLFVLNMFFVAAIFYSGVNEFINSISEMHINNSGNEHLFGINYFFIGLNFLVNNTPYVLNILIVFSAISLLESFNRSMHSKETITKAEKLARICRLALSIIVLVNILYNILQLIFGNKLLTFNSSLPVPLLSVIFVLACLLFVRLLQENKDLKDESDSFI